MKVMESSAVFQPKQRAEKASREDGNQSKAGPNPNLRPIRRQNRPLFEVPMIDLFMTGTPPHRITGRQLFVNK